MCQAASLEVKKASNVLVLMLGWTAMEPFVRE
jgi:hypothetical protein